LITGSLTPSVIGIDLLIPSQNRGKRRTKAIYALVAR
jgi:hypothetical protein